MSNHLYFEPRRDISHKKYSSDEVRRAAWLILYIAENIQCFVLSGLFLSDGCLYSSTFLNPIVILVYDVLFAFHFDKLYYKTHFRSNSLLLSKLQ